jgi:capsular polysaccharide biosynthesis protein
VWMDGRLPVLAGAAAGLAAAAVLTLLQSSTYRADASIALVRQGQPPGDDPALAQAAEAAAELFRSRAVVEPAIANLRLDESPDELLDRVDVESEPGSSLVRVAVDAPSADEARRTAQEFAEVSTVLFNDRFGPQTSASIWEAPRAQDDPVSPKPARNLALGALLGALAGSVLLFRRRRPVEADGSAKTSRADARLQKQRLAAVAARERQVARRAAELNVRERELAGTAPQPVEPPAPPAPPPEPEAVREAATGPFHLPRLGEWTVGDVERLLAEQGDAFPDRREELGFYVDSIRDVAGADGRLPAGVEAIVEEVFADLIARSKG